MTGREFKRLKNVVLVEQVLKVSFSEFKVL